MLTVLYFAIVALATWGTVEITQNKLERNIQLFSAQDWVGNYVVVEKTFNGTTASFFSPSGHQIGSVIFTERSDEEWGMVIEPPSVGIEQIVYTNQTEEGSPIMFNATCVAQQNHTGNNCITGGVVGLVIPYVSSGSQGTSSSHQRPEFYGDLNITISAFNPFNTLNISSNTANVSCTNSEYQGIGGQYPPLGSWYYDNNEILQVLWSPGSNRACGGLTINLSNSYEGMSWSVLGIVWGWWKQWVENSGCS